MARILLVTLLACSKTTSPGLDPVVEAKAVDALGHLAAIYAADANDCTKLAAGSMHSAAIHDGAASGQGRSPRREKYGTANADVLAELRQSQTGTRALPLESRGDHGFTCCGSVTSPAHHEQALCLPGCPAKPGGADLPHRARKPALPLEPRRRGRSRRARDRRRARRRDPLPGCYVPGYRGLGYAATAGSGVPRTRVDRDRGGSGSGDRRGAGTERVADGVVHATALVIDRDGTRLGFQDKVQIDPSEDGTYAPAPSASAACSRPARCDSAS
jgi:hypothetical protein